MRRWIRQIRASIRYMIDAWNYAFEVGQKVTIKSSGQRTAVVRRYMRHGKPWYQVIRHLQGELEANFPESELEATQ